MNKIEESAALRAIDECIAYAESGSMRGKPAGWHSDMIGAAKNALAALAATAPRDGLSDEELLERAHDSGWRWQNDEPSDRDEQWLVDFLRKFLATRLPPSAPTGAASPATAPEPAGFMAFGSHNDGAIPLPGYCNETELGVKSLILDAARREGYKGTVAGRMLDLGWWIEPVYRLATPSPTGATVPGVLTDALVAARKALTNPAGLSVYAREAVLLTIDHALAAPPSAHREQA